MLRRASTSPANMSAGITVAATPLTSRSNNDGAGGIARLDCDQGPIISNEQEFQRDDLTELQVVSPKYLPHAVASEPADDAVAPAKERAGGEAAVIDRIGRRQPPGWRA